MGDWRDHVLRDVVLSAADSEPWNPLDWPGYDGASAVSWGRGTVAGAEVIAVRWDFTVYGGSFGERDATAFCSAADTATAAGLPLVSLVRSGGTRLQEGLIALAGMPRATLAVRRLAAAGLPHLSVADAPTTGGVWVTVTSRADVRAAVRGAAVGFGGPRVVEAVTGAPVPADSHTAESAFRHGLVDIVLDPGEVEGWLATALRALRRTGGGPGSDAGIVTIRPTGQRSGAGQVAAARTGDRPSAGALLKELVTEPTELRAPRGDPTVRAALGTVGRTPPMPVVAVGIAADRGVRPTPDGYRLLTRAARLADRLGLPLLTLVDVTGAEPGPAAEADGQAAAVGDAMAAVLACRTPTLCVLVGEGGSGGALAAACTDRLFVAADSYFAAIGPEGAAAALRMDADQAMDAMRITPRDAVGLGFADGYAEDFGPDLERWIAGELAALVAADSPTRVPAREARWGGPVRPRSKP